MRGRRESVYPRGHRRNNKLIIVEQIDKQQTSQELLVSAKSRPGGFRVHYPISSSQQRSGGYYNYYPFIPTPHRTSKAQEDYSPAQSCDMNLPITSKALSLITCVRMTPPHTHTHTLNSKVTRHPKPGFPSLHGETSWDMSQPGMDKVTH